MASADERESTKDTFLKLIWGVGEWTKLKKYWQTRSYLLKSRRPFANNASDLRREDVMGPLEFNLYETTLAGIPGATVAGVLWFLFPGQSSGVAQHAYNIDDALENLAPLIDKLLKPFVWPTLLFATAWIASWASLRKEESNKTMRRRMRNAYLYYDGALGLYPEAFGGFMTALYGAFSDGWLVNHPGTQVILFLGYIVAILWQARVTYRRIPLRLFTLAGYVPFAPTLAFPRCRRLRSDDVWYGYRRYRPDEPKIRPPKLKFWILFTLCGPIVLEFIRLALTLLQGVVVVTIAWLQVWVHSRVTN